MLSCMHEEELISADYFTITTAVHLSVYYVNTFKNLKISINNVSTNCKLSFWITLIELIFVRIESTNFTSFDRFWETRKNYLKTV